MSCTGIGRPDFSHLLALTDENGTYEHAKLSHPRRDHGYCTDDVARVLVVACREPDPTPEVWALAESSLRFLEAAQTRSGAVRNRRASDGTWSDGPAVKDWWGRSLWGLGTAASRRPTLAVDALALFDRGAARRSPWPRSMAFAALGAAEVLDVDPANGAARALLSDAAMLVESLHGDPRWPWPESRLTYANAVLPEALVAAGAILERADWLNHGLELLGWLLDHETAEGHLSVVPASGEAPDEQPPRFDQQPLEVAALADACHRAWACTGDRRWADGVRMAVGWFNGDNDSGVQMWSPATSGGYDGLEDGKVNANQGAESTIAMLSTFQHVRLAVAAEG